MKRKAERCRPFETLACIEASGEISRIGRFRLDRHCMRCAACSAYRRSISAWENTARDALDIGDAGATAVQRILRLAPVRGDEAMSRPTAGSHPWLRPAFAGLALFLVVTGLSLFRPSGVSPPAGGALALTSEWTELDTWSLEVELLHDSLHALQREFFNLFDPAREDAAEDLDNMARELISLEEALG